MCVSTESIFQRISFNKINDVSEIDPKIKAQPDDTGFANHIVPNDQNSEPPLLVFGAFVQACRGDAAHASVAETSEHQGLRHDDVWSGSGDSRGQRMMRLMTGVMSGRKPSPG